MTDPDVVDALWAKIEPVVFITRDQFARGLDDWEIEVVRDDKDEIGFVVLVQGAEIHFESFGSGIPITQRMIRERLAPIMRGHGYVTTRTPKDAERQHRFNRAFGFEAVGEDEFYVFYRMDKKCL